MIGKGWFAIDGIQEGDRTLAEQMTGLDIALAECADKRVADLGCAEGLISLEFARAGAASVYGCDYNQEMVRLANNRRGDLPVVFEHANLNKWRESPELLKQYDIVLALAIIHKLLVPIDGLELLTSMSPKLIVIRLPRESHGIVRGKHDPFQVCNVTDELHKNKYRLDGRVAGPRGELVQYFRRR